MRSFYRNPDIESDKDNIIPEDMSQDSFIKGMKNACAGVLQIAYESLINAVNETRMKEFVCNGYLPWERALSKVISNSLRQTGHFLAMMHPALFPPYVKRLSQLRKSYPQKLRERQCY